jgi:hypothetical protein
MVDDPREELAALRRHLDELALRVVGLAPAPEGLSGEGAAAWHVASAGLARATSTFLDSMEERLDRLDHALDVGRPDAEVVSLETFRRAKAEAGGSTPTHDDGLKVRR